MKLTAGHQELEQCLMPYLRGKVFHVTTTSAAAKIISSGALKLNTAGRFAQSSKQSGCGYFAVQGCISMCDLRAVTDRQIDAARDKFDFFNPPHAKDEPVFFFLREEFFACLQYPPDVRHESAAGTIFVPDIEVGYPGELPVDQLDADVLYVTVKRPTPSPRLQAIKDAGD